MDWTAIIVALIALVGIGFCASGWTGIQKFKLDLEREKWEHDRRIREETLAELKEVVKKPGAGSLTSSPVLMDLTKKS